MTASTVSIPKFAATVLIPAENIPTLEAKIRKINKRIMDKGLDTNPIIFFANDKKMVTPERGSGKLLMHDWVTVVGDTAKFAGWEFLATFHHDSTPTLANSVPGAEVPERFWKVENNNCDHCRTNSATRKRTFLVHNSDTGEYKRVGSTCVKDFLGHGDPAAMVRLAGFLLNLEEEIMGLPAGPKAPRFYDARETLAWTSGVVRNKGFVSAAKANNPNPDGSYPISTASFVAYVTGRRPNGKAGLEWDECRAMVNPTENDYKVADETIDLVNNAKGHSEWIFKLKTVATEGNGYVSERNRNLWISAIVLYLRKESETKKAAPNVAEGRQIIEGTIIKREGRDTLYGYVFKATVEDADGRKYWGTVPKFALGLTVGDTIRMRATVQASYKNKSFGFYKRPARA